MATDTFPNNKIFAYEDITYTNVTFPVGYYFFATNCMANNPTGYTYSHCKLQQGSSVAVRSNIFPISVSSNRSQILVYNKNNAAITGDLTVRYIYINAEFMYDAA